MINAVPLACFLSMIRPPGVQFDNALLQIAPVDKTKCPLVRDTNDITFQLYTRYNPLQYQELVIGDDEKLFASHMNFKEKTIIFFHAFMEMTNDGSGQLVREAYMMRGDVNFIFVDASKLEAGPWYLTAAENTWYIGRFGAKFIDYLVSRGLDLSKTHLIGHSLGGQSAGVAGGFITSGRVARITGLDPALPLFAKLPLEQRLDPTDADFVDVIHTDSGIFGINYLAGHADFFPNGGISPQPGCELKVVLHQQQFFNKCDRRMTPHGYYTFYLTPVKTEDLSKRSDTHTAQDSATYQNNMKLHNKRNNIKKDVHKYDMKDSKLISKIKNIYVDFDSTFEENSDTFDLKAEEADLETTLTYIKLKNNFKELKRNNQNNLKRKPDAVTSTNDMDLNLKETHSDSIAYDSSTDISHVKKRQKRFINIFQKSEATENENLLFRILEFLNKNRRHALPVFTVMREINTLVKSANGELNHSTKERNNYIGHNPPLLPLATYNLELGSDSKVKTFVKRLLGLKVEGDRLTITGK